ncbi:MAG: hypothetical protein AB1720_07060 [Pseudomonadota bacterium]
MTRVTLLIFFLGMVLAAPAWAADPVPGQAQERERIYGYELMTPQERNEHHSRMRAAKTEQEREQIRLEHHRQMQERAKAQGKTLPDMPPAGMGPGAGPGPGYRR